MKRSINQLLIWACMELSESDRELIEAIFVNWDICSANDISEKLGSVLGRDSSPYVELERVQVRHALRSLLKLGMPLAKPELIGPFFVTRGKSLVDNLRGDIETFIVQGFQPDFIEGEDGKLFHWNEDFQIECNAPKGGRFPKWLRARPSRQIKPVYDLFECEFDSPTTPAVVLRNDIRIERQSDKIRKAPFHLRIRWVDKASAPKVGTSLRVFLDPVTAGIDHLSRLATLAGTQYLSPTARIILNREEVLRSASDWDTFFRFRVADRVTEFIPLRERMTDFRDALSKQSNSSRYSARRVGNSKHEFYVPYTTIMHDRAKRPQTKDMWKAIVFERLFRQGGKTKTMTESTRCDLETLDRVMAEHGFDSKHARFQAAAHDCLANLEEPLHARPRLSVADAADADELDDATLESKARRLKGKYNRRKRRENRISLM